MHISAVSNEMLENFWPI